MIGRPESDEAAPYYFTYINQTAGDDPVAALGKQIEDLDHLFAGVSEEKSLYRYAPEKWSIRQVVNHLADTERLFCFRAMWFARGFDAPLPSFEQEIAAAGAQADRISWAAHTEELWNIRNATISLFQHLPPEAWMRSGIASGNRFTVRALAFIVVGHTAHHLRILRERYF
jgi:DinB superfamily